MSSGVKGVGSRVSIPNGVKKMINNIKEITGQNHSEDEIYAMLKECNMDPNETTQKLLLLDTFHEVKRKRDRRKEVLTGSNSAYTSQNMSKEPAESKWKPGPQARANRGRGNHPSRYVPQDAGVGRNVAVVKENAASHLTDKGTGKVPFATSQDLRKNETSSFASPATVASNGPSSITSQSTNVIDENHGEGTITIGSVKNTIALGGKNIKQHQILDSSNSSASGPPPPAAGSYLSSSDIVPLSSSQELKLHNAVNTIQPELGTQDFPTEQLDDNLTESKAASAEISAFEVGTISLEQKVPNEIQGVKKNQHSGSMQTSSSAVSRPSSNYNNRSQVIGPQKVGPGKEWKPKSTIPHIGQGGTTTSSSEVLVVSGGSHSEPQTTPILTSKETTLELQRKLEETHISDSQHVIIPDHLHVPEVEKLGFCFGSFDASFGLDMNQTGIPGSEKPPLMSDSSDPIDGPEKELQLSNQDASVAAEDTDVKDTDVKYPDHPQSPSQGPENIPTSEVEVSSSINPDYSESKPEVAPGIYQHPVVHTSNYSFGFMPPTLGGQLAPSEISESQARDASRMPGFVIFPCIIPYNVPQSFDPASYYAQFYRPGLDSDGRISPFQPANKYTGNAALVSAQTSQTPQEASVPLVLSTASQTPLVTQAAGIMQSTMTATQQPLPVFRHPTGVHLPHYPPNYMPYGPYFSPFYVPPPAIHQFMSNGAFPQQPQATGGLYQSAPGTNAKSSVSQYKQGSNTGSSVQIGVPGNYGPYGLSMPNYTSGSTTAAVTSTSNEDIAAPQAKENNAYVSGQQNDGSGVWYTAPGRDISALQASSFYNLPQGQLAFAPSQPGHGPFSGVFHPAQAVTTANIHPLLQQPQAITNSPVDMVGPTPSVYQQPQHTQLNWPIADYGEARTRGPKNGQTQHILRVEPDEIILDREIPNGPIPKHNRQRRQIIHRVTGARHIITRTQNRKILHNRVAQHLLHESLLDDPISRLHEISKRSARVHDRSSTALRRETPRLLGNFQYLPSNHDPLYLHAREREVQFLAIHQIPENQLAANARVAIPVHETVRKRVPVKGLELGREREGPTPKAQQASRPMKEPTVPVAAPKHHILHPSKPGPARKVHRESLDREIARRVGAVPVPVVIRAALVLGPAAHGGRNEPAARVPAAHVPVRARVVRVIVRARLVEAVVARDALYPVEVAARVEDQREVLGRRAHEHVHQVFAGAEADARLQGGHQAPVRAAGGIFRRGDYRWSLWILVESFAVKESKGWIFFPAADECFRLRTTGGFFTVKTSFLRAPSSWAGAERPQSELTEEDAPLRVGTFAMAEKLEVFSVAF
ncbi:hypothetical protein STAS_09697 [Striga asiatica]|uniref:GBF-interacting protein 1 N-terminal domain-containing protein n=1 Tax=Striga asiatica TaxID=4170 RepID=A0A5A7PLD6_STRAF|nr:hypothetical protein STAS_09697 [Striga asiatica]